MRNRDRYILPLILLVLTDVLVFGGSVLSAYLFRFSTWFTQYVYAIPTASSAPSAAWYWSLALYVMVIALVVLERLGFYNYREGLDRGVRPIAFTMTVVVSYIFLMAWIFLYVHNAYTYDRMAIFLSFNLTIISGFLSHILMRALMRHMVSSGIGFNRTLLIGARDNCHRVLERLRSVHGSRHQIIGLITTDGIVPKELDSIPVVGKLQDAEKVIRHEGIDRVIVALPDDQPEKAFQILDTCRHANVDCRFVPELFESLSTKLDVTTIDGLPTISLGDTPLYGVGRTVKQAMDLVIASVAAVMTSPIMLFCAALIKLDSRGPVFYTQVRMGSDGRVFTMYKFRTMRKDSEVQTGPVWAKANDNRCTRVGRLLRRTNLDELPQIVNVLRGEMSLVGPRPERPHFVNQFKLTIPQYMRRHVVKSGITGWAQVNGLRGNTSVEERTKYDIFYIDNWSVFLDLKILVRTLFSIKNAY